MSPPNGNQTCLRERAEDGPPLFQHGNLVLQVYHIGWLITGLFAFIATVVSFWLVNKHLQWYTNKREQRYIVRLLFMVPIYALVSFASFVFWNHSTVLILVRDGYESTVLTSFFYLLLMYISHDIEEQKAIFRSAGLSCQADLEAKKKGEQLKRWVFPLGFIKWKPQDGLFFLQLMKWGVLQYCVIRPTTTLAAVILDYMGLYCEESWGLGWGHIYITIIVSLSVTIAMYCLIQLYVPVSKNLAPHRPLLKLFAIKAVVFLTFWQATFLSVLSMFGVVKDAKYMTAADINIGIGAILETVEMTLFAFLHIRAFTYKPYRPIHSSESTELEPERTPRLRSLGHAMDFRETFREIWVGWIYIWDKMCGREPTPDVGARRVAYYEEAFGRPRPTRSDGAGGNITEEKPEPTLPQIEIEVEEHVDIDIEGERQWLGGFFRRERSDSLTVQIEKELEKRGYSTDILERGHVVPPPKIKSGPNARRRSSWWRRMYNRFSEHSTAPKDEQVQSLLVQRTKRQSQQPSGSNRYVDGEHSDHYDDTNDPVSPAVMYSGSRNLHPLEHEDVLPPLPIIKNTQTPESSDVDSPHGRMFLPNMTWKRDDEATWQNLDSPTSGSTHNVTQQRLRQCAEFGAPAEKVPRTQYKHRNAPGTSANKVSDLVVDSPSESRHTLHRREFAHHQETICSSSLLNGARRLDAQAAPMDTHSTGFIPTRSSKSRFFDDARYSSHLIVPNPTDRGDRRGASGAIR